VTRDACSRCSVGPNPSLSTSAGFSAMCLGMFMAVLDVQVVATSLPIIQASLKMRPDQMSWIQTGYLIAETIASPLTGAVHPNAHVSMAIGDLVRHFHRCIDRVRLQPMLCRASDLACDPIFRGRFARPSTIYCRVRPLPCAGLGVGHDDCRCAPGACARGRTMCWWLGHRDMQLALVIPHQPWPRYLHGRCHGRRLIFVCCEISTSQRSP